MNSMSCQSLDQHDDARKTAFVSVSTSDLELFDAIDELIKEVALNNEGALEALEASCATHHILNSMTGSKNNFHEIQKRIFNRAG